MYGNHGYEILSGQLHTCLQKSAFSTRWATGEILHKTERECAGKNQSRHRIIFFEAWPAATSGDNHAPKWYRLVLQSAAAHRRKCGLLLHTLPSFLFHKSPARENNGTMAKWFYCKTLGKTAPWRSE